MMNTKHLLVFIGTIVFVVSHSVKKRYYFEPLDLEECQGLNRTCTAKLADVGNLLINDGFTSLVTNGILNIDCSNTTRSDIHSCITDAYNTCQSLSSYHLDLWTIVYDYICGNETAFINAEVCLSSGVPDDARKKCDVGASYYSDEIKCSYDPDCVWSNIGGNGGCNEDVAGLFSYMVRVEYSTRMGDPGQCSPRYY